MKVVLGQINTTPGDFEGNGKQICYGIEKAAEAKADIVVFPELSIPGYLCKDMMFENGFIKRNYDGLTWIKNQSLRSPNLHIVVGFIDRNKTGHGKPFRNMLAVIKNGDIIGEYQKHLLPFYDVFDEGRYFEPGKELLVLDIAGEKTGFCICEDIWNDKGTSDYSYEDNPINSYRKVGISYLVNISSSPFTNGKPKRRHAMLETVADKFTLIYVNQHGGQDDLVFDGHSCIIRNSNTIVCLKTPSLPYNPIYEIVDVCVGVDYSDLEFHVKSDIEALYDMTKMGLHDYMKKSGFKTAVLGSSGGIDSALVATLACEVLGPKNVHCIMMPSVYSSEGSVTDAKSLHTNLGCMEYMIQIDHKSNMHHINNSIVQTNRNLLYAIHNYNTEKENHYETEFTFNKSAEENLQARMRGMNVMFFSNAWGALALTTGNKTELATGYCTLYGDMNGGFAPISDLYKMQVYEMCNFINAKNKKEIIPQTILNKAPSAELAPGQTDEASLLPYPVLDRIVMEYIENYVDNYLDFLVTIRHTSLVNQYKLNEEKFEKDYKRIIRLININEFKRRQAAPGIKLSKVAFGTGRRVPICKMRT